MSLILRSFLLENIKYIHHNLVCYRRNELKVLIGPVKQV